MNLIFMFVYYNIIGRSSIIVDATNFYNFGYEWNQQAVEFNGVNTPCSKNIRVTQVVPDPTEIGEEPFWDGETNSVYYVDSLNGTVHRFCVDSKRHYYAKLGDENVGVIIPIEGTPDKFFITYGDNLAILTWNGVSREANFERIGKPAPSKPYPRYFLNDAKIARNGALFIFLEASFSGNDITAVPRGQSELFSIYCGHQKTLISGLDFGNGLGFSYNGEWFYFSDTVKNVTWKSLYNQRTNSIENTRVLLDYAKLKTPGEPDSMTVDAQGFLWVAYLLGSRIFKVDPNSGRVMCSIQLLAKGVTNVTFGKCPNAKNEKLLECLYVTTLRSRPTILPRTKYDGGFFLVEGVGSTGVCPDKLRWNTVFGRCDDCSCS